MQADRNWCVHSRYTLKQFGLPDTVRGSVLDIGCSAGGMSQCFTPDQYLGIDCMLHTVRTAQQTYPHHNFAHFDCVHPTYNPGGVLDHSDLSSVGRFDWIFLRSVYTHMTWESAQAHLESVKKCLTPGGRVYYTLWSLADVIPVWQKMREAFGDSITPLRPEVALGPDQYLIDGGVSVSDPESAELSVCSFFDVEQFAVCSGSEISHRQGEVAPRSQWVLMSK